MALKNVAIAGLSSEMEQRIPGARIYGPRDLSCMHGSYWLQDPVLRMWRVQDVGPM